MPCDSVIVNRVEMPAMHPELTGRALKEMGASGVWTSGETIGFSYQGDDYTLRGGVLSSSDVGQKRIGEVADLLKRQYSVQVVKQTARANGWQLQQTGEFNYKVVRR